MKDNRSSSAGAVPVEKKKIYCGVCRVSFYYREPLREGEVILCPVCAAKLEIILLREKEAEARKLPQEPRDEIYDRVDAFARLKGYIFKEDKDLIMEGLMEKKARYGDFYCPCRFDNIPENICPCLETRQNQVRKEGSCL